MEGRTGLSQWALSVLASAPAWGEKQKPKQIEPEVEADEGFELILNFLPATD
jgi:hypothetical protein